MQQHWACAGSASVARLPAAPGADLLKPRGNSRKAELLAVLLEQRPMENSTRSFGATTKAGRKTMNKSGMDQAGSTDQRNLSDWASIDSIIKASYDLISGPAGHKRDWGRMHSLFMPGARLIPTSKQAGTSNPDGTIPTVLDFDGY